VRAARTARWVERALYALGAACLAVYAAACAQSTLTQAREQRAFDAAVRERARAGQLLAEPAPDTREWDAERVRRYESARAAASQVQALGRLDIPSAGISVMVLDGTDDWTLNRGVGRIEGTARPGEPGNVGIAGHRDGFFRGLRHVQVGDVVELATLSGVARYEVSDIEIVPPDDVEVLAPTQRDTLTLVTCHPFYYVGDAPNRFVVRARRTGFDPWTAASAEAAQPTAYSAASSSKPSTP
jgi:sortase A